MSKFRTVCVSSALAALLCATASAFATTVTLADGDAVPFPMIPFAAIGSTALTKSGVTVGCETIFTGTVTTLGDVQVTSVAFNGPPALCQGIKATATPMAPWIGKLAKGLLTFNNVGVTLPSGGKCGPSPLKATVTDTGTETVVSFSNATTVDGCIVAGSLVTTPYMHPPK